MSEEQRYGGLVSTIIAKIMGDFGITQEMAVHISMNTKTNDKLLVLVMA